MAEFNEQGSVQNAWPEYFGQSTRLALEELNIDPSIDRVFFQDPSPPEETPPIDGGKSDDVWVYGDGDGNVLAIPRRGTWHPNRLSPGWPDLVGVNYKTAIHTITTDVIGVKVVYGPDGFPRIEDINRRRVFLDVDKAGNVVRTPHLG